MLCAMKHNFVDTLIMILKYQVLHETNKSCIIFNYAIRLKVKIHKKN